MFTGIVSDIGTLVKLEQGADGDRKLTVDCGYDADTIELGASICCSGICLTVTEFGAAADGSWFCLDASNETVAKTTLGGWRSGAKINLERALTLSTELGGHLVTGHVDGIATIVSRLSDGESERFVFEVPDELARFIAEKGSVALDGTSLTVNEVDGRTFGVNLIAHTLTVTTWGDKRPGDKVNLEVDLVARYVARLREFD